MNNATGRPRGRPLTESDEQMRELVIRMSTAGIAQTIQAKLLKIDTKTLRKHFNNQLDYGKIQANKPITKTWAMVQGIWYGILYAGLTKYVLSRRTRRKK